MAKTTISEEKDVLSEYAIKRIVYRSKHVAITSDALRSSVSDLVEAFVPLIRQSGITFSGHWHSVKNGVSQALIIHKRQYVGWKLEIARTTGDRGWFQEIGDMSRADIEEIIKLLPAFLLSYSEELERQNINFADLRKKAAAMLEIVER